jgi:hypothetical protein
LSCELDLDVVDDVAAAMDRVRSAVTGAGGQFAGDATAGTFGLVTPIGAVRGSYAVSGQRVHISVLEKPVFLGCGMIEDRLKAALRDGRI